MLWGVNGFASVWLVVEEVLGWGTGVFDGFLRMEGRRAPRTDTQRQTEI